MGIFDGKGRIYMYTFSVLAYTFRNIYTIQYLVVLTCADLQPNQADILFCSCMHLFHDGCFHINFGGLLPMGTDILVIFVTFSVPHLKIPFNSTKKR